MDEDVHRLVGHIGLRGVEDAVILAVLAPRVLDHEILVAEAVFRKTVDLHTVVVRGCPVVEPFLTHLLRDCQLAGRRFLHSSVVRGVRTGPACSVRTRFVAGSLRVGHAGDAVAAEAGLADVSPPGERVTVTHGVVHHLHEFIEGQVVALGPTPVVLDFDDELRVERMVREGGERDVIVRVQAKALHVALRRVGLPVFLELLGQFADITVIDAVKAIDPAGRELAEIPLGDGAHVSAGHGVELVVVEERVAIETTRGGHGFLRHHTVVFHTVHHVIETAALRERDVAMEAHGSLCAVNHGVIDHKGLAQVVRAFTQAEQLTLEESQGGEGPARTALVLVLDRSDRIFFDYRELHGVVFRRCFLFLRSGGRSKEAGCRSDKKNFLHLAFSCYYVINFSEFNRSSDWRRGVQPRRPRLHRHGRGCAPRRGSDSRRP